MSAISKVIVDKIVLFGDSITELSSDQSLGFNLAPALQHEYFRKLQVITRGYGGYNSEHARHILDPILDAETAGGSRIRLLTIFFGTNDAAFNAHQHVPLERYEDNLRFLVRQALSRKIPVILIGPAPFDEYSAGSNDRSTMDNCAYSETARHVAEEIGVPFIDLWHGFLESKGWKEGQPIIGKTGEATDQNLRDLLTDGVHFSGKAYRLWYDFLLRTIRDKYPELRMENLPTVLPHIFDIDNSNLPDSLWQEVKVKGR